MHTHDELLINVHYVVNPDLPSYKVNGEIENSMHSKKSTFQVSIVII